MRTGLQSLYVPAKVGWGRQMFSISCGCGRINSCCTIIVFRVHNARKNTYCCCDKKPESVLFCNERILLSLHISLQADHAEQTSYSESNDHCKYTASHDTGRNLVRA